jgi:Cof subfamily protein (haloacid dehalogenase superfamily)
MPHLPISPAIVFFDIDGTLVVRDSFIPESALEAIAKMRENGIIAACGTHIVWRGQTLLNVLIDQDLLSQVVSSLSANRVEMWLEGPEHIYLNELQPTGFTAYIARFFKDLPGYLATWHQGNLRANKVSYHLLPESNLEACLPLLEQYFTIISHGSDLGEIVPQGYTKATGIQYLLHHLDLPHDRTYAFGDSMNDVEMLSFVKHGIAMGGSRYPVIQVSDHVTDAPEDHGIANALRHYQLID